MVTGSNWPVAELGLVIMLGGEALCGEDLAGLRERLERGELDEGELEAVVKDMRIKKSARELLGDSAVRFAKLLPSVW